VLLVIGCAFATFVGTATPVFAAEPVVVVATDRPEERPAASTTFLAGNVYSGRTSSPTSAPLFDEVMEALGRINQFIDGQVVPAIRALL
jgi:hypothetical protein